MWSEDRRAMGVGRYIETAMIRKPLSVPIDPKSPPRWKSEFNFRWMFFRFPGIILLSKQKVLIEENDNASAVIERNGTCL